MVIAKKLSASLHSVRGVGSSTRNKTVGFSDLSLKEGEEGGLGAEEGNPTCQDGAGC
jgi:hypothetical protein